MEINVTDSVAEDESIMASGSIMTVHHDITGEAVTSLSGDGHTIINLPIGKDGTLLNAIPTAHGFMIATGPDGTVYLDAAQMAMLTQNAQITASFASLENANLGESGKEPIIIQDILELQELAADHRENTGPAEHAKDSLSEILPPVGKGPFHCETCGKIVNKWNLYQRHLKSHADDKPHRCNKCDMSFNVESNLTLHLATHNPDDLTCPECGKSFKRVASLKSHLMLHEKEESLVCPECSDEFTTMTHLTRHMKSHRQPVVTTKLYVCKKCDRQFNKASELRLHMKAHYRIKASLSHRTYKRNIDRTTFGHTCTHCNKQFQKPSQLLRHSRIHTGERPFACEQCGKTFNQKGAKKIHQTKHSGLRPFCCEFCSASFSQRGNLRSHIQRVHVLAQEGNQKLFRCEECPCAFKKLGSLHAHMSRSHLVDGEGVEPQDKGNTVVNETNVKDVIKQLMDLSKQVNVADLVGKNQPACSSDILQQALQNSGLPSEQAASRNNGSAGTNKELNQNIEQGTNVAMLAVAVDANGEANDKDLENSVRNQFVGRKTNGVRWRQCLYCSKIFKKPSDLVRHIRTHTHEKPFKCKDCFRSFTVKSTLTAHLRTHSGIKEFGCIVCSKFFSTQGSLNVHNRLHSGAKPFECPHCDRQFRTSGHRKNHLMSHFKSAPSSRARRTPASAAASRKARRAAYHSRKYVDGLSDIQLQEPIFITGAGVMPTTPRTENDVGGDESETSRGHRPFECGHCGRKFKKSSHLKQHLRSHTGEKPFTCTLCQRGFVSSGVLTAHMRTHLGVKVTCMICEGTFTTNGSLKRHMSTHSEVRPFMCPYCQKTFKTSVNCKKHMKTHRQELAEQAAARNGADKVNTESNSVQPEDGQERRNDEELQAVQEVVGLEPSDVTTTVTMSASTLTLSEPLTQECLQQLQQSINQHVFDCVETDVNGHKTIQLQPSLTFDQSAFEQFTSGQFTIQGDQLHSTLDISGLGETLVAGVNGELVDILLPPTQESCQTQTDDQEGVSGADCAVGEDDGGGGDDVMDDDDDRGCEDDAMMMMVGGGGGGGSSERENEPELEHPPSGKNHRRPYTCPFCMKKFKKSSHLKQHLRSHTGEKPYKCHECNRMFVSAGVLKSHQKTHRGIKDFKCSVCDVSFTTNGSLTRHFLIHSNNRPFKCLDCHEMFRTAIECRRHVKTHSRILAPESPEKLSGGDLALRKPRNSVLLFSEAQTVQLSKQPADEFTTVSEKILIASAAEKDRISEIKDRNAQVQTAPGFTRHAHECDVCKKTFKKPSDLVRHMRIHTGEKPYQCSQCNKQFTVKSTLDSHLKTHTHSKSFDCHVCSHQFATKGSLKVHMRLHTGAKPFKCPHCDLRFRTSGHRKSHILSHTKTSQPKRRRPTVSASQTVRSHGTIEAEQMRPPPLLQQRSSLPSSPTNTRHDNPAPPVVPTYAGNDLPSVCESECEDEVNIMDNQQEMNRLLLSAAACGVTNSLNDDQQQQQQFLQLADMGTNVQLQLSIPGLESMLTRSIQIDASLLQQLQQQGHLNLTISPNNILAQGLLVDTLDMGGSLLTVEEAIGASDDDAGQQIISLQSMDMNAVELDQQMRNDGATRVVDDDDDDELRSTEVSINITESGELMTSVLSQGDDDDAGVVRHKLTKSLVSLDHVDGIRYDGTAGVSLGDAPRRSGHACVTCNRSFAKPSLLARHLLVHTGEKPYKCLVCGKSFNQKNGLKVHSNSNKCHIFPTHKCRYCNHIFPQKENLIVHIQKCHPGEVLEDIATTGFS